MSLPNFAGGIETIDKSLCCSESGLIFKNPVILFPMHDTTIEKAEALKLLSTDGNYAGQKITGFVEDTKKLAQVKAHLAKHPEHLKLQYGYKPAQDFKHAPHLGVFANPPNKREGEKQKLIIEAEHILGALIACRTDSTEDMKENPITLKLKSGPIEDDMINVLMEIPRALKAETLEIISTAVKSHPNFDIVKLSPEEKGVHIKELGFAKIFPSYVNQPGYLVDIMVTKAENFLTPLDCQVRIGPAYKAGPE